MVERDASDAIRRLWNGPMDELLLCNNLRQVVHSRVLLTPSSVIWYR